MEKTKFLCRLQSEIPRAASQVVSHEYDSNCMLGSKKLDNGSGSHTTVSFSPFEGLKNRQVSFTIVQPPSKAPDVQSIL